MSNHATTNTASTSEAPTDGSSSSAQRSSSSSPQALMCKKRGCEIEATHWRYTATKAPELRCHRHRDENDTAYTIPIVRPL